MSTHGAVDLGLNRTGIGLAPQRADAMREATIAFPSQAAVDVTPIAVVREEYARDADPIGSIPPPTSVKGTIKTAADAILGRQPIQLIDKLGERLAFERGGARLYEAIYNKLEFEGAYPGGPTLDHVQRIILQEHAHFRLVERIVRDLGADPTVVTPSANLHAVMTTGAMAVVVDPRTTVAQCLEAALLAELVDNAGWEVLHQLLLEAGHKSAMSDVEKALRDEADHLFLVKRWLAAAQGRRPAPGEEFDVTADDEAAL